MDRLVHFRRKLLRANAEERGDYIKPTVPRYWANHLDWIKTCFVGSDAPEMVPILSHRTLYPLLGYEHCANQTESDNANLIGLIPLLILILVIVVFRSS